MKTSKNKENASKGQGKSKDKTWKNKAQERGAENRSLRKRQKELIVSRDLWKTKYQILLSSGGKKGILGEQKAKCHQYSLLFVMLVVEMQKYGTMSLRSCRHCVGKMLLYMGLLGRVPSHSSIRNWVCKSGYYRVKEWGKERGQQVVYVDESIVFGSEKILLILGISESSIPQDRSVSHSDIEVLYVGVSQEWKSEAIAAQLALIGKQSGISYIVSDEGNNLCKAYKLGNYEHIEDCTHVLANHLKHIYQKNERFEEFRKLIGKLRMQLYLSKENSQFMPPNMRGKLRFANIFPCIDWAKKWLDKWETLSPQMQKSLSFLKENQDFIDELVCIEKAFKLVCATLKNEGFGRSQKADILKGLSVLNKRNNTLIFKNNIKGYLANLTKKSKQLKKKHLLCSSDIIESFFGKFKQKINPNSKSGLSEFIFTIANFTKPFTEDELKLALEKVKIVDFKNYKNQAKAA